MKSDTRPEDLIQSEAAAVASSVLSPVIDSRWLAHSRRVAPMR